LRELKIREQIVMTETKRRDFIKNATLTIAGAGILTATTSNASAQSTLPKVRRMIAINGSHRTGKTCAAGLKLVLESAKVADPSLETELVELASIDFNQAVVGTDQPDDALTPLLNKIASPETVAIVVASPVYFGLPSGRCVSFFSRLQPLKRAGVFKNKVFGALASGGARNGGQETVLHALIHSALTLQVILAVDGVPTSHWGGTLWNQGDSIEQDEFGKNTAKNLGTRIAELIALTGK
jgi:multimeric flavodoxin WrbA